MLNDGCGLAVPMECVTKRKLKHNTFGPVHLVQKWLPPFPEKKKGLISNVTSVSSIVVLLFNSLCHGRKVRLERHKRKHDLQA